MLLNIVASNRERDNESNTQPHPSPTGSFVRRSKQHTVMNHVHDRRFDTRALLPGKVLLEMLEKETHDRMTIMMLDENSMVTSPARVHRSYSNGCHHDGEDVSWEIGGYPVLVII